MILILSACPLVIVSCPVSSTTPSCLKTSPMTDHQTSTDHCSEETVVLDTIPTIITILVIMNPATAVQASYIKSY